MRAAAAFVLGTCVAAGAAAPAAADSPASPPSAPSAPAAPEVDASETAAKGPDGPWVGVGLALVGGYGGRLAPGLRLEAGLPPRLRPLPGLSLVLPVVVSFQRVSLPDPLPGSYTVFGLTVFPGAQYEWPIPIHTSGRPTVLVEAGVGVAMTSVHVPDMAYAPAHWEVQWLGAGRGAVAFRYGFASGLTLGVQPLGLLFVVTAGQIALFYEGTVSVGWRLP
ncbi:MAG TPA: hypothetical protein VG389_22390 [Myxococcota bacterium]|jgi:hypothetical protein|nr:hypothetical protein [Myxococcota bacterium]